MGISAPRWDQVFYPSNRELIQQLLYPVRAQLAFSRELWVSFASLKPQRQKSAEMMNREITAEKFSPKIATQMSPKPALIIANAVPSSNLSLRTSVRAYLRRLDPT